MVNLITANIGGIDDKKEIPDQSVEPIRRFYFEKINSYTLADKTDREKALWFKTRYFNSFNVEDVTIWLDGKIQPLSYDFVQQILDALGDADLAAMKHLYRSCIYQEIDHIEHCIKHGNQYLTARYGNKPIRKQVEAYRYFGYPANAGLFDCCIIAFRATERVDRLTALWWEDIIFNKAFDQVAFPFWAWKHRVEIKPIVFKPNSFIDVPHKIQNK